MTIEGIHEVVMTIRLRVPPGVSPDHMKIEVSKSVSIASGMYPNLIKIEIKDVEKKPSGPALGPGGLVS